MPFPKTLEELVEQGYKKLAIIDLNDRECRQPKCKAPLTWWKTPAGKNMPMDRGTAISHFGTCKFAKSFRRER